MIDYKYKDLVTTILEEGYNYKDPNRTGVIRKEIPSYTIKHTFKEGFPAITLKKLAFKNVVTELIWFLRGDTNIKYLVDNGCNIWNKDAYSYYLKQCEKLELIPLSMSAFITDVREGKKLRNFNYTVGNLGKVYGHYWRNFNGVDQIEELIHDMINKPMSSELLVVARDPSHKEEQVLPCCHYGFQIVMRPLKINEQKLFIADNSDKGWSVDRDRALYGFELHWKQRSVDTFLGLGFNISSYALLALILEKITGHKALGIQGDLKKVHLYDNSIEASKEILNRDCSKELVTILFDSEFNELVSKYKSGLITLDGFFISLQADWFKLDNYNAQEALKVEMLSRT